MSALAIPLHEAAPSLTTVYCCQAFWRDRHKLAQGRLRQFKEKEKALEAGEGMARRNAGVVVFMVQGNPEVDYWSEPVVLAVHGDVPGAG